MLRPLAIDLILALFPPLLGAFAFVAGTRLRRLPSWLARGMLILTVGVVAALALVLGLSQFLLGVRDWSGPALAGVGGAPMIVWPVGLFLLGVVWSQPGRSTSSAFLGVLAGLAWLLLGVESAGRLWWRWADTRALGNFPNKHGCVQQTTWLTCGPAAAAMLLQQQGIQVSEGELAYRARCSLLLGTDLYDSAAALTDLLQEQGMSAQVERLDYQSALERDTPFVANVYLPGMGGHALYVERLAEDHADVIDPRHGQRSRMPREEFEVIWEGRGIWIGPELAAKAMQ
jgi:hypothetical protein